ncbi:MAG: hypothetical protein JWN67_4512 [Actinomycetia bacterium]|nr:hypothetical protein [Actinomycetes bacterium]
MRGSSARKVAVAAVVGIPVGVAAALLTAWQAALLIGWSVTVATYLGRLWPRLWRHDAAVTSQHATQEDGSRVMSDLTLLATCLASLVAVGLLLVETTSVDGTTKAVFTGVGVVSVVLSWALVHTIFTLRYAHLYYDGTLGGIDFHDDEPPTYHDFAYLAFTVGMTYQVSDTEVNDRRIRATILRHALLSFLFGTTIIALTINVVAGLRR